MLRTGRFIGFLLLGVLASPLSAQEVGREEVDSAATMLVEGEVLDAVTGRPMAGILVALHDLWKLTRTDELGYFSFANVPVGGHELGVYALGYLTVEAYVDFVPEEIYAVNLAPAPVEIEGLEVAVLSRDELDFRTFGQRYDFIGPDVMEDYREKYIHITDVLRTRIPGIRVSDGGGFNTAICVQSTRGTTSMSDLASGDPPCALMMIDGMEALSQDVAALHMEEIESVRYLARMEALLVYGNRGKNGVLIIETRSGRR